jgi:uncharacterized protein YbaP (TraB family)
MTTVSRSFFAAVLAAGLALLAPLHGQAQTANAEACPPASLPLDPARFQAGMRQAQDHGFLWRMTKDGRTSYLYGTLHAAEPAWMFPGPRTAAAFEASDVLALELDVLDADIRTRLIKAASARPDDRLPAPLVARLEKRMAADCLDAAAMRAFVPEFQIASLAMMAARREGLDPSYAIDLVLGLIARDFGKATISLETPEAQLAALRMPTREATIEFVTSGLDELDAGKSAPLLAHMASAWKDGNLDELEGYERWCDCLNTAAERASMKRLLDDRNPLLAAAIDKAHAGGRSVFAAVGSLHMIGARGLPALMRERGYVVEQIRFGR